MTYIVPFEAEFCGKVTTIYSVNNDNPNDSQSSITTSEQCPHCNERHVYKVYEPKDEREEDQLAILVFDCKCPSCRKNFDIEAEFAI